MLELGAGADIVRGIGTILWGTLAIALLVALLKPKTIKGKAISALLVLVCFFGPILPGAISRYTAQKEFDARYAKAVAVFDERCKGAGEKIYKRVDNVEGILLLNIRGAADGEGLRTADPLWPDAALPHEPRKDDYIRSFLYWEKTRRDALSNNQKVIPGRGSMSSSAEDAMARGYRFVDVKQSDGTILRYRLDQSTRENDNKLAVEPVKGSPARYAIGFVNDVSPEVRKHWVAGTTITVSDTQTGEIVAQRVLYAIEPGLGNTGAYRMPWLANPVNCPRLVGSADLTRYFVDQILKPL
jgi:hypothetical protein